MQGRARESGTLCLGNTHPHARTCFHSVKCVLDHGKASFQTVLGCRSPFPLAGNLCCLWKARASKENVLRLTCAVGRNMLFRGGWGVGSRGPVISLLLPRYHPVLSGGQGSLYVNTSLPGSPGSGTGRRQRHEGTGFWGTNPHRNSSRGPTCVQGGKNKQKQKPSPCTWENTPS